MKKDIRTYNRKGQSHGYQEWYWCGQLSYRGKSENRRSIGYTEWHHNKETEYHIK